MYLHSTRTISLSGLILCSSSFKMDSPCVHTSRTAVVQTQVMAVVNPPGCTTPGMTRHSLTWRVHERTILFCDAMRCMGNVEQVGIRPNSTGGGDVVMGVVVMTKKMYVGVRVRRDFRSWGRVCSHQKPQLAFQCNRLSSHRTVNENVIYVTVCRRMTGLFSFYPPCHMQHKTHSNTRVFGQCSKTMKHKLRANSTSSTPWGMSLLMMMYRKLKLDWSF